MLNADRKATQNWQAVQNYVFGEDAADPEQMLFIVDSPITVTSKEQQTEKRPSRLFKKLLLGAALVAGGATIPLATTALWNLLNQSETQPAPPGAYRDTWTEIEAIP